jgi:hypothetical protein
MRPWLRLLIGTAAVLPLVLRLGYRHQAGPRVAIPLWVLTSAGAVLLIARRGLVGASFCEFYPRCVTPGHPYIGVAAVMTMASTAAALWLWDKGPPRGRLEHDWDVAS